MEKEENERCGINRNSKDKKINKEDRRFIEERSWSFLNGKMRGDGQEKYTYKERRGNSVIDYNR